MGLGHMIAKEIQVVEPDWTLHQLRSVWELTDLNQLPVVEDGKFLGLIEEERMEDYQPAEKVQEVVPELKKTSILLTSHAYEVFRMAQQMDMQLIPVVDQEGSYHGSITRQSLLETVLKYNGAMQPGGILVLEITPQNYSLADIARICESEDVIVFSAVLFNNPETRKMELTLKTNKTDLQGLAATFERYGYTIAEIHGAHMDSDDILDRYKLLMNYINM